MWPPCARAVGVQTDQLEREVKDEGTGTEHCGAQWKFIKGYLTVTLGLFISSPVMLRKVGSPILCIPIAWARCPYGLPRG